MSSQVQVGRRNLAVHRCIAVALYRRATGETDAPALALGGETEGRCCPGGLAHMGFAPRPDFINRFVSTGRAEVRGGGRPKVAFPEHGEGA
ncbi:hypothetical protein RJ40_11940 [Methanofollis aquaemaris]|uniref:Uncharacterized protein n=1 Tax=Methanofollis aquaemaris TaxID=126734 RepID=A0A8A3S7Y5_9EURY|nr:hypothetical protein [Methanofollis aquaemaris]QSZ68152.1 hypothetical protein RJ40_11940 [Methanofollis aquaemaris]